MSEIKIAENFWSCQGEGQYVGVPSIFLRTFGCNFTCSGFGLPKGEISKERDIVASNIDQYDEYMKLPLVTTGCDSYASWDPRFKHLSPTYTISQIVDKFQELLPDSKFSQDKHLIITGGEPLLPKWQKSYVELLKEIQNRDMELSHLTFETNGTKKLDPVLKEYLCESGLEITFSVSAKLPCSGEKWEKAILPEVVKTYLEVSNHKSYFKFVVSTQDDIDDAKKAVKEYRDAGITIPVYLMPVGGVNSIYELNERQVADFCRDNGFRFSPRIQVPLYKNAWAT
jgi:organic radical activating enzyme